MSKLWILGTWWQPIDYTTQEAVAKEYERDVQDAIIYEVEQIEPKYGPFSINMHMHVQTPWPRWESWPFGTYETREAALQAVWDTGKLTPEEFAQLTETGNVHRPHLSVFVKRDVLPTPAQTG